MKLTTREMTLVAIFPAMMAVTAQFNIPMGSLPAISLQTLFVYLAGLTLGWRLAGMSMFVYVMLGVIGLPVFTYGRAIEALGTGSGGFIIGFIISAMLIGYLKNVKFINNQYIKNFIVLIIGTIVIYVLGALYITYLTNTSFWLVLGSFYIYFIGDLIKIVAAIYVYKRIRPHLTYE